LDFLDIQGLSSLQGNHHYDSSDSQVPKLDLDEIESKMVVEARDMDLKSKLESGLGGSAHQLAHAVEKPMIYQKSTGLSISKKFQKEDRQASQRDGLREKRR
jgi:hypothetical protein